MSTITEAKIWKDVGFTDGCMEVPSASSAMPAADFTFAELNPTKARMFSELRVPAPYTNMLDCSYLAITVDMNNGTDRIFYGWVDSVEMVSDTGQAPITQLNWHVDLWRTYLSNAEFGSGMVKRRPYSNAERPPQQPSYRYMVPGNPVSLYQNDGIWWVIVALTVETADPLDPEATTVSVEYRLIPVSSESYLNGLYITGGRAMPLCRIFNGDWDEAWGIDPTRVISVFLSPICPYTFTGTGSSSSDPIDIGVYWNPKGNDGSKYFTGYTTAYPFSARTQTFGTSYITSDVTRYDIRGFDGETIGSLPWGISVDAVNVRLVYSTTSAYVQLRFRPTGAGVSFDYTLSHQYGLTFNIPCWALDVTENTWSSYVYSGQRQYDMEQRQLSTESAAVSGGLSLGASALSGLASGAMLGSVVPGVGTIAGAVIGAVGGALTGAVTTGGMFAYESLYKNDEMQRMEDYAHAMQADRLLLPGNGIDCIRYGGQLTMVPLTMDTYSRGVFLNDMQIYGVKVSEPMSDCTSLIEDGGPMQIQNLIVTGDIPPNAKDYIKQRFSQGVIIV